jgi:Zn-finger nucleic acid-binding protein
VKCPSDDTVLQLADRVGIEIDYCPTCRGVWLDRGELDKIIERADADRPDRRAPPADAYDDRRGRYDERPRRDDRSDWIGSDDDFERGDRRGRRRSSFLGDLFDIG